MLDIIIVNYNSTDHLLHCLNSLQTAIGSCKVSIFVQDNASSDHVERISARFPKIILKKNSRNLGFAKAVNQGMKQGTSEFVMLLNPDTSVGEGFFEKVFRFLRKSPDIGVLGPKILDADGGLQNSARSFPTPLTAFFGRTSFLSKTFPKNPVTSKNLLSLKSDGKTPMEVDWVSGACMIVRRKAVREVGGLDERFFMYWEDADWCRRMWQGGWKVVYYPQTCIHHYVGGSSEKNLVRSVVEFHKSVFLLFEKHQQSSSVSLLKPLVFGGLASRLVFVLLSHFMQRIFWTAPGNKKTENLSFTSSEKRKIRIIRVISRLNIGGPSIHVCLLNSGLDPERFENRLVAGKISPQEGDMGYLIKTSDMQPILIPELQREIHFVSDIRAFSKILKLLFSEKPDIVDTHTAKAGTITRLSVIIYNLIHADKIVVIHTFHGHVFESYFNKIYSLIFVFIERLLAAKTDVIIVLSSSQQAELVEKYRIISAEKVRTIRLGFDLSPFYRSGDYRHQFRSALKISTDTLLIGIIGRLVPIKNHALFFDIARKMLGSHPDVKMKFVVVGDGELREKLETYCREIQIDEHVIFCGWVQNVAEVYADLDILALTSLNEGTPVSIIESMAASVPVVATDAGGVKDLLGGTVKRGRGSALQICERGLLCDKNDVDGFVSGLTLLITEDRKETELRVERARIFVEKEYSHDRLLKDMERLYRELIKGKADLRV